MNLKTKFLGLVAAATLGTQAMHTKRADLYKRSVAIHREMISLTRMEWGNPLPFKSEILSRKGGAQWRR